MSQLNHSSQPINPKVYRPSLVNRKCMPISVLFRLAHGPIEKPYHPLQVRLTVNGGIDSCYRNLPDPLLRSCKVLPRNSRGRILFAVDVDLWDKKAQRRKDRSVEATVFNDFLSQIRSKLTEIYLRQAELGITVTKSTVWNEFRLNVRPESIIGSATSVVEPVKNGWTVIEAVRELYIRMEKQQQVGDITLSTLNTYSSALRHVNRYFENKPNFLVEDFTTGHALDFYLWIRKMGPMNKSTASRRMEILSKAFDILVDDRQTTFNPIKDKKWPRESKKKVVYLNKAQVEELLSIQDHTGKQAYLYWAKLMILTGMDHPDIERYMKNRAAFEFDTHKGRIVKINRSKKPHGLCVIPIDRHPYSETLISLIEQKPPKWLKGNTITKKLIELGRKMKLDFSFNTKVCRKTAGTTVFLAHFSMEATSRMLGHSSVAMTEAHYGKTTEDTVLNEL